MVWMVSARAGAEALPSEAGIVNVRDYGATGNGRNDDTAAVRKAIAASGQDTGRSFWRDRIVYFPNGTYLVSDTLDKRYNDGRFGSGMILIGQSQAGTIIRLADHAPGFHDPGRPKAIIFSTSKHLDGTPTSGGKDYVGLGEGNDAYMNFVEDLTVDAGGDNPGAIGIDYLANNIGAIRDVTIRAAAGSGAIGLAMKRKWPGPALVQRLTVRGFDTGIATAQTEYGITLEHIRLIGQHAAGLSNNRNVISARDLSITGTATPIVNDAPEGVVMIDGAASRRTAIAANSAGDWSIPIADAPAPDPTPPENWANVQSFGASPDTGQDSAPAFLRAFASGASTIVLPHGVYAIGSNLSIPSSVHRIVGMMSTLTAVADRPAALSRSAGLIRIISGGPPVAIEKLAFDNSDRGDQLAIEVSGDRDVVIRDIVSAGVRLLDRKTTGGRVFLEDTCCGRMQIAGPQPVYARQLDTEGSGVRILNVGAPLWVLGLKTEGVCTVVDNRDGARTEIAGGLLYQVHDSDGSVPAFMNTNASLSLSFAEESLKPISRYRIYVANSGAGGPENIEADRFPKRGYAHVVSELSVGR